MISVRHRRAEDGEWLADDPVIPDGELALVHRAEGYDVKIGDGSHRYSELSPIMGRCFKSEEASLSLSLGHRDRISLRSPASLSVTLAHEAHGDYVAMLSFSTEGGTPEFSISASEEICYSGAGTDAGAFVPEANMHYTLLFWKDFRLNCHARGVYVG